MPRGVRRSVTETQESVQTPASVLGQQAISPRAAETRRERRRRDDGDLDRMASMKLAVPRDIQEQARREGKVLRWIMDTRISEAHANDWDKVSGVEPIQANPMSNTEERLVLCSKFADWHDEDQRKDARVLDDREQQLMNGNVSGEGGSSAGLRIPRGQRNELSTVTAREL